MKITEKKLRDFLRSLGPRGHNVLAALRKSGCHGERQSKADCPLSCAVRSHFDDVDKIVTDEDAVFVESSSADIAVALPPGCREFVSRYDAGQYRTLTP